MVHLRLLSCSAGEAVVLGRAGGDWHNRARPNSALLEISKSNQRCELELELIPSQMAQKPILRGEVGARALRVRTMSRGEVWASAGVQGAWVSGCGCEAD